MNINFIAEKYLMYVKTDRIKMKYVFLNYSKFVIYI